MVFILISLVLQKATIVSFHREIASLIPPPTLPVTIIIASATLMKLDTVMQFCNIASQNGMSYVISFLLPSVSQQFLLGQFVKNKKYFR